MSNNWCACDCWQMFVLWRTHTNPNSPATPINGHSKAQIWIDLALHVPVLEERKKKPSKSDFSLPHVSNAAGMFAGSSVYSLQKYPYPRYGSVQKLCQGAFGLLPAQGNLVALAQRAVQGWWQVWLTQGQQSRARIARAPAPPHRSYTFCFFCPLPPGSAWHQGNCPKLVLVYHKILCCLTLAWTQPLNAQIHRKITGKVLI